MSRAKGVKNERRADQLLQEAGYDTYRPENASYDDNDLWNLFDVAGRYRDEHLYFLQVKSNIPSGMNEYFDAAYPFSRMSCVRVGFATRRDGQPGPHTASPSWQLAEAVDGRGYRWVVDERGEECEPGEMVVDHLESKL